MRNASYYFNAAMSSREDVPMPLHSPVPLVSYEDIITHDLPPVDWLVTDLIAKQDRVVVYGEFGSLKSWLLLDLALAIAAGQPWLGRFAVPHSQKVLYVDEEMSRRILTRRVKQLGAGRSDISDKIPFSAMSLGGVTLKDETDTWDLLKNIKAEGCDPDVVILETLRRVMVGSELEAQAVAQFWKALRPFQECGKTVIVSHHMRKTSLHGGNALRDRASGSTDILGGADTAFAVTRTEPGRVVLNWVKSRNAEEAQPFAARFQPGDGESLRWTFDGFVMTGDMSETLQQQCFDTIMQHLSDSSPNSLKPGEIKKHVLEKDFQPRTYERAWKNVRESGQVVKYNGRWRLKDDMEQAA